MTTVALAIANDHPAFAGHFPGHPIVPGAVLLDLAHLAITQTAGLAPTGLAVAKFYHPVTPGTALHLDFDIEEASALFIIRTDTCKVADGKFLLPEHTS